MSRARVLVTSATGNSGLAVVRALGRAGYEVVSADRRRLPFGLRSRYATAHFVYPTYPEQELIARLLDLVRAVRPDVLYPLDTTLTGLVAKHRPLFENLTGLPVPEYDSFLAAFDNARTLAACRETGVPGPATLGLGEALDRLEAGRRAESPTRVVVKPRLDWGGARGVSFPSDPQALREDIRRCEKQFGEAVLQEFVPGIPGDMRTVLLLFDRGGELAASFTMRKLRQWPPRGGITAAAVSTYDAELVERVLPLLRRWRWRGAAEVELKVDPRDGEAKLIEVNPRFGNYIGFPVACGLNLPALAVRTALGEELSGLPAPGYATGVRYLTQTAFWKSVLADLRDGPARLSLLRNAWRDLRAPHVGNGLDVSDPWPRVGKFLLQVQEAVVRRPPSADARRDWLRPDVAEAEGGSPR